MLALGLLMFFATSAVCLLLDWSMPTNILLVAPQVFRRFDEPAEAFRHRYKARRRRRLGLGLMLATASGLAAASLRESIGFGVVCIAISIYGAAIFHDMLQARSQGEGAK